MSKLTLFLFLGTVEELSTILAQHPRMVYSIEVVKGTPHATPELRHPS